MIDAGERIAAEKGLAAMTLLAVQRAAGQRNNSAATYHFGSRDGLISAIGEARMAVVDQRRKELLAEVDAGEQPPSIRALARVAVEPMTEWTLGQEESHWGRFLLQGMAEPQVLPHLVASPHATGFVAVVERLQQVLGDLPPDVVPLRIDAANSLLVATQAAIEAGARGGGGHGVAAEVAASDLVDEYTAVLEATVSPETAALVVATEASSASPGAERTPVAETAPVVADLGRLAGRHPAPPVLDARTQLMVAGERIVAEQGFAAMTLRAVQEAAGQRNRSAVSYHFGSRRGLLDAVVEARMAAVTARRSEMVEALAGMGRPATVREVVATSVRPLAEHLQGDPESCWNRFLLRSYTNPEVADVVASSPLREMFASDADVLAPLVPHIPAALLRHRLARTEPLVVMGLANLEGEHVEGRPRPARIELAVENLVDVCTALVEAPVSPTTQALLDRLPPDRPRPAPAHREVVDRSEKAPRAEAARRLMIDAAERIVAEQGFGAMTLQAVQTAAGQRNKSAARYHFGSRDGLVEAVIQTRMQPINDHRRRLLDELEASAGTPTVRQLLRVMVEPVADVVLRVDDSCWARFLLQAMADPGALPKLVGSGDATAALAVVDHLRHQPALPQDRLRPVRVELAISLSFAGLAGLEARWHVGPAAEVSRRALVSDLLDVCAAVVQAPAALPLPRDDADRTEVVASPPPAMAGEAVVAGWPWSAPPPAPSWRDARTLMIDAAERIVAEQGLGALTLQAVQAAAGQRNNSAASYHFGSRAGLLSAIIDDRTGRAAPRWASMAAAIDELDRPPTIREVVAVPLVPLGELVLGTPDSAWGRFLFQSLSDPELHGLVRRSTMGRVFQEAMERLAPHLGEVPASLLGHRTTAALSLSAIGLAAIETSRSIPSDRTASPEDRFEDLLEVCAAALLAPPSEETLALLASDPVDS